MAESFANYSRAGALRLCGNEGKMTEAVQSEGKLANPFMDAPNAKKMMTLIAVYLGVMANLMVSTTNSIVFPAAAAEIGGMEIYGLAQGISGILSVCVMPIFGFIAARNPATKRLLAGGGFAAGAIVLLVRVFAPNMMAIIIANIFWGLVSGAVFAVGFTMVRDMYDKQKAGVYLGLVGTMMSAAMLIGPFFGGFIVDNVSWRVWSAVPMVFLAVAAVLMFFGVKATKAEAEPFAVKGGKFDFAGAAAITVFLAALIIVLSMGSSYVPFGSTLSFVLLAVSAVALVVLVFIIKKKGNDAIVPVKALKDRNTMVFAGANFLHNFGAMTISFFIGDFIMRTLATDPICEAIGPALAAGIASALMAVLGLFLGPIFGKMIAKSGNAKGVMTLGNIVRIIVMGAFVFVLVPGVPVWVIYILMFVAGIFNSQQTVTQSAGPQIQLTPDLRTLGNSVVQLGSNLGAGIGMAVFTLLVAADPASGMRMCMIVALAAWVVLFFITFLLKPLPESVEDAD